MAMYVVSYDLQEAYDSVFAALKTATDWCRPLLSFWIIETPLTPSEVIGILLNVGAIDDNDGIVVLEISGLGNYRRVINYDVAAWLDRHITLV